MSLSDGPGIKACAARKHTSSNVKVTTESLTKTQSNPSGKPTRSIDFSLKEVVTENHKKNIYGIKFCERLEKYQYYFGSVGATSVTIYKVDRKTDKITQVYQFEDENPEEIFYCIEWGTNDLEEPLICVGGAFGVLKVINLKRQKLQMALIGHGDAINEIKCHPIDDDLCFTASADRSVRLWNIRTGVLVAIFAGEGGHTNNVLSMDIHMAGNCFVSAGMDTDVKVWNLVDPFLLERISQAAEYNQKMKPYRTFEPIIMSEPLFSTTSLHGDFIDCVKWFGDMIFSKSTYNRVVCWIPDSVKFKGCPMILREFQMFSSRMWFLKYDMSLPLQLLAVPATNGKIYIYSILESPKEELERLNRKAKQTKGVQDPNSRGAKAERILAEYNDDEDEDGVFDAYIEQERFQTDYPVMPIATLTYPHAYRTARQVCFSNQGDYLIACFDDSQLHLWKINSDPVEPQPPSKKLLVLKRKLEFRMNLPKKKSANNKEAAVSGVALARELAVQTARADFDIMKQHGKMGFNGSVVSGAGKSGDGSCGRVVKFTEGAKATKAQKRQKRA